MKNDENRATGTPGAGAGSTPTEETEVRIFDPNIRLKGLRKPLLTVYNPRRSTNCLKCGPASGAWSVRRRFTSFLTPGTAMKLNFAFSDLLPDPMPLGFDVL
ncbi:hypothetical protein N7461_008883 [Penicillium sp. DV-2018c]|nr:hypothetical protein N7461_008883 [Penicillium sp. DV-2018c]